LNFGFYRRDIQLGPVAHEPHERGRMQGLNDLLVFGGVNLRTLVQRRADELFPGGKPLSKAGPPVNIAMIPFLVPSGRSLIWLMLRHAASGS